MDLFTSEKLRSRSSRLDPGFLKMLLISVLLHLLLVVFYVSPLFHSRQKQPPPGYQVSLVNAPVLNPQAGRPEATATPQPPAPASAPAPLPPQPDPLPEAEAEPEAVSIPEPEPEPEPIPEPGPTAAEREQERLAEERSLQEEAERQRQLAEEQRKREEAERQKRLAEEQRKREEDEKRRLAEEQRKREEAERQKRLAEEQRKREEAERQRRLDEIAAQRQRTDDEQARQERLDALRAAARAQSQQLESPIPDAPVGMPDGRGTEAGVSPSAFVQTFIRQNWTFARHQAIGNPEAEVYLVYNAAGTLLEHRFIRRSGHTAFDESLIRALTLSRQLPQPLPQTMHFTIIFNLKEMLD